MTDPMSSLMLRESAEAPDVVARQAGNGAAAFAHLGERLRARPPRFVLTCARGSSDHAALYGKYLIEQIARVPVGSFAPSVVSVADAPPRDLGDCLFLAISQSGRSPDIVAAATEAREAGALVVALVNVIESPLAAAAEVVLPLEAGPERSVAATKSYIASLAALLQLVRHWTGDPGLGEAVYALPETLRRAAALDWSPAVHSFEAASSMFVVSRGAGLGVAAEAALKCKETSALHAEAFSAAEVEHGPMTLVREGFPVLFFVPPDASGPGVRDLAARFADRGARVTVAGADVTGAMVLPSLDALHPLVAPLAWVQSFYPMAAHLALARGYDPDRPAYLNKVTETR